MNYYRYDPDADNFAGIAFEWDIDSPEEKQVLSVHDTEKPMLAVWTPPTAHGFEDNPPTEGDFPSLSNYRRIPVMSQRAWDALHALIGHCCEALPITHQSGRPYYVIHVMETLDALDEEHSELTRNATTGRINRIHRYAFKDEMLAGKHIFKMPLECGGELFVDEEFRKVVEGRKLQGLLFEPLPLVS